MKLYLLESANGLAICFNDAEFLLAAVSHTKLKLYWIDDLQIETSNTTIDSDADFFSDRSEAQSDQPHLQYLQDSTRDLSVLNKTQAIKSVLPRFNSTIPSSAPVERLFSTEAISLSKRRNRPSDDTVEKLLLLKVNRELR